MGIAGMHIGFWWENLKEGDHYKDLDIGGRIILQWILERQDGMAWAGLIWAKLGTSGGLLQTWLMNIRVSIKCCVILEQLHK
jgi:hypothetical protein